MRSFTSGEGDILGKLRPKGRCIPLSSFVFFHVYRIIKKNGQMKHEITLFHTMEPIEI